MVHLGCMTPKRWMKLCKKHRSWRVNMIGQELQRSASELWVRLEEEILQKRKRSGRRSAAVSIELRFRLHSRQFLRNLESSSPKALKVNYFARPAFKTLKSLGKQALSSGQTPRIFHHGGAGGGIRTHGGLRQRILSPPPCLRLFLALPI